jgi:voltage-gated potassium channel
MTESHEPLPEPRRAARPPRRAIIRSVLRTAGSVIALVAIYYLLPLDKTVAWVAITILVAGLILLFALVVLQVRSILASPFPGLRALESLAVSVPFFLVLFAGTYVAMARISSASFGQPLTHTDALYFTATVFTTVGFGDITARTEAARLVVTGQMIMDVVIIGVAIQAIVGAARQGRKRQSGQALTRPRSTPRTMGLAYYAEEADSCRRHRCRNRQQGIGRVRVALDHDLQTPAVRRRAATLGSTRSLQQFGPLPCLT